MTVPKPDEFLNRGQVGTIVNFVHHTPYAGKSFYGLAAVFTVREKKVLF
jgi:hypothetical protein